MNMFDLYITFIYKKRDAVEEDLQMVTSKGSSWKKKWLTFVLVVKIKQCFIILGLQQINILTTD